MCGIAGYSVRIRVDDRPDAGRAGPARSDRRTGRRRRRLRLPRARRTPTRPSSSSARPRRSSSSGSRVPAEANQLLVHVRDYTKGHPSIAANNHPVRHGPVVGIHNGIITNDDELLAPHSCARAEPRMTVDSEAIFALAAHSRNDAARARAAARRDGDRLARRARAGRRLRRARQRPPALARRGPRAASSSPRRSSRSRSSSATAGCSCASARCARARGSRSTTARSSARERFRPDLEYVEADPLPAVRAPGEREFCLTRLALRSRRDLADRAVGVRPRRPRRAAARGRGTGTSPTPRAARRTAGRPATRSAAPSSRAPRRLPVAELRQAPERARERRALRDRALEPLLADRDVEARLAERASTASRTCASRATPTASSRAARGCPAPSACGRAPRRAARSCVDELLARREPARHQPGGALGGVPRPEVLDHRLRVHRRASGSAANSFIVGERPSRSPRPAAPRGSARRSSGARMPARNSASAAGSMFATARYGLPGHTKNGRSGLERSASRA